MRRAAATLTALAALAAAGCGWDSSPPAGAGNDGARERGSGGASGGSPERPRSDRRNVRSRVRRARCTGGAPGCIAVTGRVLYVEAVDPDGDGDAHYVLAGGSVTAPGLSAIDVAPELRPRELPRRGDLVSAAGPVRTGSYGQRQIEATVVHHQRR